MTRFRTIRASAAMMAGVAPVLGAMILAAPPAYAQTEQQIKAGCNEANGTYQRGVDANGDTTSSCCYHDYKGVLYCDDYRNGSYITTYGPDRGTKPIGPVTGSTPPVAPPISNAPAA